MYGGLVIGQCFPLKIPESGSRLLCFPPGWSVSWPHDWQLAWPCRRPLCLGGPGVCVGGARGTGPNSSSKLAVVKGSLLTFTYFWTPACKHFPRHFGCAPSQCASPSAHTVAAALRYVDSVLMAEKPVPVETVARGWRAMETNKMSRKESWRKGHFADAGLMLTA